MEKHNGHRPGSDTPVADEKHFANLRARLAIRGRELREIRKGDRAFFEVRHDGGARTCSTAHEVDALIAQIDSAGTA